MTTSKLLLRSGAAMSLVLGLGLGAAAVGQEADPEDPCLEFLDDPEALAECREEHADEAAPAPAPEPEAAAEPAPEPDDEPEAEAEPEAEPAPAAEAEPEAEPAPAAEAEPETEPAPAAEAEPEAEPAPAAEADPLDPASEQATERPAEAEAEAEVVSEEELDAAQRAEIEAAVEAAIAAERARSEPERESARDDRMRILGAAAAGLAAGAILPGLGSRLVGQTGDRVILQQDDRLIVRSDELSRLLALGGEGAFEETPEGLTRLTIDRPDGSRVLTWRDASGEIVRRVRVLADGTEIVLYDEGEAAPLAELPPIRRDEQRTFYLSEMSSEELERALAAAPIAELEHRYTLRQVRENEELRWLMPSLALDAVTFEFDSAQLTTDQLPALDALGQHLSWMIARDPDELFLVEGHTDAVGAAIYNLALSDRRAETVATLLSTHYDVPPENLITQGYGKQDLKVPTLGPSRENRRVEVRRITPLLR